MKKRLPVIIAFILTIAAAFFFSHIDKEHRIYNNNVNSLSYIDAGLLEDGEVYRQILVCKEDVLNGFRIKNSIAGAYEDVTVRMEIYDAESEELITAVEEPGSAFKRQKIHYYKTEVLSGMKGRKLLVSLSESGSSMGNGILMYYVPQDGEYKAMLGDRELDGLMPVATVTDRFDTETFIIFLLSLWFIWGFMWFLYKLFQ